MQLAKLARAWFEEQDKTDLVVERAPGTQIGYVNVKLIKKIASGAVRPLLPASSVLFSCARSCCQLEAADRPKADETLAQLDRAMLRVETMKSRAEARK